MHRGDHSIPVPSRRAPPRAASLRPCAVAAAHMETADADYGAQRHSTAEGGALAGKPQQAHAHHRHVTPVSVLDERDPLASGGGMDCDDGLRTPLAAGAATPMGGAERAAARQFAYTFGAGGAQAQARMQQAAPPVGAQEQIPGQAGFLSPPSHSAAFGAPAGAPVAPPLGGAGLVSPVTALANFMAGSPFSLASAQRRPTAWPAMPPIPPLGASTPLAAPRTASMPPLVPVGDGGGMSRRTRGRSASERSPGRQRRSAKRRACDSMCSPPPRLPAPHALGGEGAVATSPSNVMSAFGGCPFADGEDAAVAFSRCAPSADATPGRAAMAAAAEEQAKIGLVSPSFCPLTGALRPILPTVPHDDLHSIDCHTLARLLHEPTAWGISTFLVVDCRFPYEHNGGHVRNSVNLWRPEDIEEYFIHQRPPACAPESPEAASRPAIIFHCEFSSARAPRLCRHLRNTDRNVHAIEYPALSFPHLFLLKGGYKDFFATYPQLCTPQAYVQMHDPAYSHELRNVRAEQRAMEMKHRRKSGGRISSGGISPRNLLEPRTLY